MHRYIVQLIMLVSLAFSSSWVGVRSDSPKASKPAVLSSTIQETFLQFEFDGYHMIEAQTPNGIEYIIDLEGGSSILDAGAPDLDHFTTSIVIPDQGTTSIEVVSSSYRDYENVMVAPSKGNLSRSVIPSEVEYVYNDSYNQDSFYPGTLAELRAPYILRDLRGQAVVIYPLQYNPQTNTLRVYSDIEVKVTTAGTDGENALYRSESKRSLSREYNNIYEDLFLNYANDTRFDYIVDEGNMLIISYGDFMDEMQPLVDWKNRKGIPTEMVNVSSIGSSSSAIESFVDNYYYENGLTYLLLVGDIAQIPSPSLNGSVSDPSYGFISGNDAYSEILVGRFSGNNPAEIITQVQRSIDYELYPELGASWYDNVLGVASAEGPGYGGMTDDEFSDFLWDTILSDYTYDSFTGVYDGSGGTDAAGINAINSGVSLVNYTGHGSITSWGNGASLSNAQINSLTNNNKLPFVITVGCNVGEFQSTSACFTETWQRATNNGQATGSIAHFGSTIPQSWEPPMHGQWAMNSIITESYDNNISRSLGGIAVNGGMHMNEAQGSSGINETNHWTFFGDPSVVLRSDQPSNLNVNFNEIILIGQNEFVVDVGIDGALASLSRNGEFVGSAYSVGGVSVIPLGSTADSPGQLDLTVTAYNKFPYESNVTVLTPEGAFVTVNSVEIDYGSDNTITAGETIDVTVELENLGNDSSSFVEVTLYEMIDNPYITIIDGSESINNLSDGSLAYFDLSFSVSNDAPYGHTFALQLDLESDENSSSSTLEMTVEALVESFESAFNDLDWSLSGNAEWSIDSNQYYEGNSSARSGTIGNSTVSTLELTMDVLEDGNISFYKRVSCEPVGSFSGTYYDFLAFYIDDVEQDRWAGEVAWSQNSYAVTAGEHTFRWTFTKDIDSSDDVFSGEDAVWIDSITFPPVSSSSNSMTGDVNGDMIVNVLDVIQVVNMALGEQNTDNSADLNQDGVINVLDVIQIVNIILEGRVENATRASLIDNNGEVSLSSDGYIGGVQMTLSHDSDFSIELTEDALVSRYLTRDNSTTLIIAAPYSDYLFTASGDYTIVDMIVANSSDQIAVSTPSMFALDAAYPNPFNPSTTMRLHVPVESNVNVSVYNLMGQQVDVLHNGLLSSGYTTLTWNAADLPSGMYIVKAISNSYTSTQKLMLLK